MRVVFQGEQRIRFMRFECEVKERDVRDDMLNHSERGTNAERSLRIGELAAEAGVNPKTIRYYEAT